MTIAPDRLENLQIVTAHIDGPAGANHLFIITGTAVLRWHHDGECWFDSPTEETLTFSLSSREGMPMLRRNNVVSHCETASLASFRFSEDRSTKRELWAFAVNSADAFFASPDVDIPDWGLNIHLSLQGPNLSMSRVHFQLTIAAQI